MPMLEASSGEAAQASEGLRMRVAFLPERIGTNLSPCASIRLHPYFEALRLRGFLDYRVLFPEELERFRPDVIAWHRVSLADVEHLQKLTAAAQVTGARLLYDLDDNLLDMDDHGEGDVYRHMRAAVAASLRVAHEVWCSTPALAARVAESARGTVHTLPNALDPTIWRFDSTLKPLAPSSALRLLYMGTRTHEEDFAFLSRVMERLHITHPGCFTLTVIGIRQHDRIDTAWLTVRSPPNFIGASYPGFVHWLQQQHGFDLGVAPLIENDFNVCKSHIKALDYAAMGLPTVASAVPAYMHALRDGQGCRLVDNNVDAWCKVLLQLRAEPQTLQGLLDVARASVGSGPFEKALDARRTQLEGLRNTKRSEPVAGLV